MLSDDVFLELQGIVGADNATREPAILDTYAFQYIAELIVGDNYMGRPCAVVMPGGTEEVQAIVRLCNRESIPYKAISTGWGAYGGSPAPGMLQLDLRRMNRILQIDADNMYAVVEPYVVGATLQAEAMGLGLNCHIAGSGANTSLLASATSVMGQGATGVFTGFSNRNLLGFEWVMPDGELLRVGCLQDSGEWFTGDGPGPSLRGVIRGFAGAFGGFGVFTKCAVKLYPWYGPRALELTGVSPDYEATVPENHAVYLISFRGWQDMKDFGNMVGEAEIAFALIHTPAAPAVVGVTRSNKEFHDLWKSGLFEHMKYSLEVVLTAGNAEEFTYQRDVLEDVIKWTGGKVALCSITGPRYYMDLAVALSRLVRQAGIKKTLRGTPALLTYMATEWRNGRTPALFAKALYLGLIKQCLQARCVFRPGGSFWTSMGGLTSWDCCIENAIEGERIKRGWIEKGILMDDGAEQGWGMLYESGAYAHCEEVAFYDQSDPVCVEGSMGYVTDTVKATIDKHLAMSLNATGDPFHAWYSPHVMNYHHHVAGIKEEFDPANLSEASTYINRGITETLIKLIEEGGGENLDFKDILTLADNEEAPAGTDAGRPAE
ncbi:MAG: FAD-binding oxidoreductase [Actinobacteria bacterium]|nr:FAD-binding oxidoreductase [Actinomycetota bacterium]MBU1944986.1 FAD-binding oxidoreductase [Actinomycetota bacterium]MBU2688467.1 FAD-binding oxidoreductase [Actinomycetota bacterium]